MAAAVVTVASEVLILGGSYLLMRRNFGFFPSPRMLFPALAVAAVMGAALWPLRDGPFLVAGPSGRRHLPRPADGGQPPRPPLVSGLRR